MHLRCDRNSFTEQLICGGVLELIGLLVAHNFTESFGDSGNILHSVTGKP